MQHYKSENRNLILLRSTGTDDDGDSYLTNTLEEQQDGSGSMPQMIGQFGHTVDVASRHYARSKELVPGFGRKQMKLQLEASMMFHQMLGLGEGFPSLPCSRDVPPVLPSPSFRTSRLG